MLLGLVAAPAFGSIGCGSRPEQGTVLTLDEKDQASVDASEAYMQEQFQTKSKKRAR